MRVRKATLVNLALMLTALGAATLVAEGVIRLILPQVTLYPRYVDSPDYPIMLPADAEIVHAQGSRWRFEYTTNRLGHRGPYLSPSETNRTTGVVAIGDSFTFGVGVNDDEVYTHPLSQFLGPAYSVINGGMGGWGLDSEVKWFFREGVLHRPRIVILQFTLNDPADFSGLTTVEDGQFTFHTNPRVRPAWQLMISRSYLLQKSHLYSALRSLEGRNTARRNLDDQPVDVAQEPTQPQENYAQMLALFAETLQQQNSLLLFVSVTHGHGDDEYHYDVDHFPVITEELTRLETAGLLSFVELPISEMRQYPSSPEGHQWSGPHHRAVARAIASEILASDP